MSSSSITTQGGSKYLPDFVYYNAEVINGAVADIPIGDTSATYNDTRDSAIISDASKYRLSILNVSANGLGRSLPLFIPSIQTGQANVNLTNYAMSFSLQGVFLSGGGLTKVPVSATPPVRYVVFSPENTQEVVPASPLTRQDISTKYYWMSTFQSALSMFNTTIYNSVVDGTRAPTISSTTSPFSCAWGDTYQYAYNSIYTTSPTAATNFLVNFPTLGAFVNFYTPPQIIYTQATNTFSILADSRCFGGNLLVGAVAVSNTFAVAPISRIFFNSNLYGLFANLPVSKWNVATLGVVFPASTVVSTSIPAVVCPAGYVYEMLVPNNLYQNVVDYRYAPYSGTAPLGFVPLGQQSAFWIVAQDYASVDSIWSPVEGLYLTTNLMPVRKEAMSQSVPLGSSDIGLSTSTSGAAFLPLIADFQLDLSQKGAQQYRQFASFQPLAEFRFTDFASSREDIHSIDIKLFWRCRLDGQLYPVEMFNLTNFSVKMMFKNKDVISLK